MISTVRQRVKVLEDIAKRKMEKMKHIFEEETNKRHVKKTVLAASLQQLIQEADKTAALERNVMDAESQNTQQSAQIQKLQNNEAELRATTLEKQHLQHEAMESISELQLHMQKMTIKLHEVEGQLIDMESKWAISPLVQSNSGTPRAQSFSADQVLSKKLMKPNITSQSSMDRGIKRRSSKQEKSSVLKHLRYSTNFKGQGKIIMSRRSAGQMNSISVEPITESPKTSTPEAKADNVFIEASDEGKIIIDLVESAPEVPRNSTVNDVVQEFEKFSTRDVAKGAIPKRRFFKTSKWQSLQQESETDINQPPVQQSVGSTCRPHYQSVAVPLSHPLADATGEAKKYESSTKRCLSPNVRVSRVKRLRAEEMKSQQKSLLPYLKNRNIPQKLQQENLRSALVCATRREDVLTIKQMVAFWGAERLLDVPVIEVFKFTPLHLAASWGYMESARVLLDLGAGLEVKDWVHSTPLHIAAFWGHAKMCRLLLGHGAHIKACNCNEETPLHLAARQGHLQVVRLMVDDWCADLDARDSAGHTPYDAAQFWNKSLVANWLARHSSFKKHSGQQHHSNSLSSNTHSEE